MDKKKPFNKYNKKEEDRPRIWKSSPAEKKLADWQLKLRAISICMSNGKFTADEVEKVYQTLNHKSK